MAFRIDERAGVGSVLEPVAFGLPGQAFPLVVGPRSLAQGRSDKGEAIRSVISANPRLDVVWAGLPGVEPAGACLEGGAGGGQPQPCLRQTAAVSRCL